MTRDGVFGVGVFGVGVVNIDVGVGVVGIGAIIGIGVGVDVVGVGPIVGVGVIAVTSNHAQLFLPGDDLGDSLEIILHHFQPIMAVIH